MKGVRDLPGSLDDTVVLFSRSDGLAQRMFYLFSLPWARWAYPDRRILLFWQTTDDCLAEFHDLFRWTAPGEAFSVHSGTRDFFLALLAHWESLRNLVAGEPNPGNYLFLDGRHKISLHEILQDLGPGMTRFLQELEPHPDIAEKVEALARKYRVSPHTIGLHIRGPECRRFGDPRFAYVTDGDPDRIHRILNYFLAMMGRIILKDPEQGFLVASDDAVIEEEFRLNYPEHVFSIAELRKADHAFDPQKGFSVSRGTEEVRDALVTLLLLSRTNYHDRLPIRYRHGMFTKMPLFLQGRVW